MSTTGWKLEHSYAQLPAPLHALVQPTAVAAPRTMIFNTALAEALGLDLSSLDAEQRAALFSGNRLLPGAKPLAQAYAGHQFGHFTMLGDGRAILLGEQQLPAGGCADIQLKGAGRTPYSRGGDGRAALGPMLREYLISEALHALNIPSTRSLAVVATGEPVLREGQLPGAVLTRVASSHIRVGTFQFARQDLASLKALADYSIARHAPHAAAAANPALALLEAVLDKQAQLISEWLRVGFIHGVMNTDNMTISGESIDFGPCAFMDEFDLATVYSSIDRRGRYAYGNQAPIAHWNLSRFAETLLPLISDQEQQAVELATTVINSFEHRFHRHWLAMMRRKLGLLGERDDDRSLAEDLLRLLQDQRLDHTNSFLALMAGDNPAVTQAGREAFDHWLQRWRERRGGARQPEAETLALMQAANPQLIPRNHRVEHALQQASQHQNLQPFENLLAALRQPYALRPEHRAYQQPPTPDEVVPATYCGT